MKNDKSTNIEILLFSAVIIIVGQLASNSKSDAILLGALFISILASFVLPQRALMPFMLCMIAPNRLLTYGPISAPTIIMLVGLLKKLNICRCQPKKFFLSAASLIGYTVVTMFIGESMVLDAIKIIVVLLFFILYTECEDIQSFYVKYVLFCSMGCLMSAGIAIMINPSSISDAGRFTVSGSGENVLGILCAIMAINILVIVLNNKVNKKIVCLSIAALLCAIGFLTGSRSFLLAIAMGIVGIIVMLIIKLEMKKLFKIGLIIVVAAIAALFVFKSSNFINNYWNQIMYRITKLQGVDVSNGRYDLWNQYVEIFKEHPVYLWLGGLGVGEYGLQYVAHNMIIEQIASFGIVGSIIILALYASVISIIGSYSCSYIKLFTFSIIPLVVLLGSSMVSHTLLGIPQTTMLFICVFALFNSKKMEAAL